jgi:hypothetical protein
MGESAVKIEVLNQKLYDDSKSFNVRFERQDQGLAITLAYARFEKSEDGFSIPMLRMFRASGVEDLKNSVAILYDREHNTEVATVEIDNLTRSASMGMLSVKQRLF